MIFHLTQQCEVCRYQSCNPPLLITSCMGSRRQLQKFRDNNGTHGGLATVQNRILGILLDSLAHALMACVAIVMLVDVSGVESSWGWLWMKLVSNRIGIAAVGQKGCILYLSFHYFAAVMSPS